MIVEYMDDYSENQTKFAYTQTPLPIQYLTFIGSVTIVHVEHIALS
jgi:hypothetical protein